jgi:hypothetical protein
MQSIQGPSSSSSARYFQVVNEDEGGGQHQLHSHAVVSSGWSLAASDSPPEVAVDWDTTHHHPPTQRNTTQARQLAQNEVQWQSRQRQPLSPPHPHPHYNPHLPTRQYAQNPKPHPFRSGATTSGPSPSEYASSRNRKRSLPTAMEEGHMNKDERDPSSRSNIKCGALHLNTYTNDPKVVASGMVNNGMKPNAKVGMIPLFPRPKHPP